VKYDFDTVIDRRNTDSLKWNVEENVLPMWVADMDFRTAPEIISSLEQRLSHGIFGYTDIPGRWYNAYISWWKNRHGFEMKKEWLMFCTGVIPCISSSVRKLTSPGDKVIIQTPVYNIFFNSILNNGRTVFENKLKYENGKYEIDFNDLEKKLSDPKASLMILCNPHNPVGKIWSKDELERIGCLCKKYCVTVLSDEIHCDITDPGEEYIPFASVNETCRNISVTAIAPTKAFNIAGLQTACISVPNEELRKKVNRAINTDEVAEPNAFAVEAAVAAFENGGEWLDELRDYLFYNKVTVREFLTKYLPSIKLVDSSATYLLWLDCTQVCSDSKLFAQDMRDKTGLYLSAGSSYGENGKNFLRMNIACPNKTVREGLKRLKNYMEDYYERD